MYTSFGFFFTSAVFHTVCNIYARVQTRSREEAQLTVLPLFSFFFLVLIYSVVIPRAIVHVQYIHIHTHYIYIVPMYYLHTHVYILNRRTRDPRKPFIKYFNFMVPDFRVLFVCVTIICTRVCVCARAGTFIYCYFFPRLTPFFCSSQSSSFFACTSSTYVYIIYRTTAVIIKVVKTYIINSTVSFPCRKYNVLQYCTYFTLCIICAPFIFVRPLLIPVHTRPVRRAHVVTSSTISSEYRRRLSHRGTRDR